MKFGIIIIILVFVIDFYPAINRYKSNSTKEEDAFAIVKKTLKENGLELDRNKKYHYDFNTNILTIKEAGK